VSKDTIHQVGLERVDERLDQESTQEDVVLFLGLHLVVKNVGGLLFKSSPIHCVDHGRGRGVGGRKEGRERRRERNGREKAKMQGTGRLLYSKAEQIAHYPRPSSAALV